LFQIFNIGSDMLKNILMAWLGLFVFMGEAQAHLLNVSHLHADSLLIAFLSLVVVSVIFIFISRFDRK